MNDQSRLLVNAIRGPIIMITVGTLFAADRFTGYHFHQTWPVLLIVIGLMQLIGGRGRRGDYYAPPAPQATPQATPVQPSTQSPTQSYGQTSDSGEPRV